MASDHSKTYTNGDTRISGVQDHTVTISLGLKGSTTSAPSSGTGNGHVVLHGGSYTITALSNLAHESNQYKQTRIGDVVTFGQDGTLIFNNQRQGNEEVCSFWNKRIQPYQSIYSQPAGAGLAGSTGKSCTELRSAVIGTLVLDVEDKRLGRMSVTFPGVGFGWAAEEVQFQGSASDGDEWVKSKGNWWFGGQTFEYLKENRDGCIGAVSGHTVRALGSDQEGRARYFYFSPSSGTEYGHGMEAGDGDIVLTRIYGH